MDPLGRVAEAKIQEAIERGEFEGLPHRGRRLELEDLSGMDPGLRASYLLLRGTGHVPEEAALRKEALRLEHLIATCRREEELEELARERSSILLRIEILALRRREGR